MKRSNAKLKPSSMRLKWRVSLISRLPTQNLCLWKVFFKSSTGDGESSRCQNSADLPDEQKCEHTKNGEIFYVHSWKSEWANGRTRFCQLSASSTSSRPRSRQPWRRRSSVGALFGLRAFCTVVGSRPDTFSDTLNQTQITSRLH